MRAIETCFFACFDSKFVFHQFVKLIRELSVGACIHIWKLIIYSKWKGNKRNIEAEEEEKKLFIILFWFFVSVEVEITIKLP